MTEELENIAENQREQEIPYTAMSALCALRTETAGSRKARKIIEQQSELYLVAAEKSRGLNQAYRDMVKLIREIERRKRGS